jgi:hypothetical protein
MLEQETLVRTTSAIPVMSAALAHHIFATRRLGAVSSSLSSALETKKCQGFHLLAQTAQQ